MNLEAKSGDTWDQELDMDIGKKSDEDSKDERSLQSAKKIPGEPERKVPGQTPRASYDVAEGVSSSSSSLLPSEQELATSVKGEDYEDSMDADSLHSECTPYTPSEPSGSDEELNALMERLPMTDMVKVIWGFPCEHREEM